MPKQQHYCRNNSCLALTFLLLSLVSLTAPAASAQDSAFLACDRFEDRGQRIACLEDALDAATAEPDPAPAPAAETVTRPPRQTPAAPAPAAPRERIAETPSRQESTEAEEESSLMDRIRNFGRSEQASIDVAEDGSEELHDTITELEKRRNLWVVTLSSGQIWMQQVPRRLNLREGDEIRIYQAGMGNGYRLAAERLSGFIRVERIQ